MSWNIGFLSGKAWIIQIFSIILMTLIINTVASRLHKKFKIKFEATTNIWDDTLLHAIYPPVLWFIWMLGVSFAVFVAGKATGEHFLLNLLTPAKKMGFTLITVWMFIRFISQYEQRAVEKRTAGKSLDQTTVHAIAQILRAAVLITAALAILQIFGISISGLLAVGGVGGVAVAFAAKDLLGNFFGGLMIFLDRPFKVGDWIRSPDKDIEGTVEHIGWRLTRIRTFDKRPLYIPNGIFSNISLENPSRMTNRRIKSVIGLRYDDAEKIDAIVHNIEVMLREHPEIDTKSTLFVKLIEFGPSSLNILMYTFTKTTDWVKFQGIQQDVFLKTIEIISQHGAECAFPTTTMHVPDGVAFSQINKNQ